MDRVISRRQEWTGKLAETAGRALNRAAAVAASVPGVGGASLVSYGLYDAWHPLGWIAAGAFLLLLDHRTRA